MKGVRDTHRMSLGELGSLPGEQLVDGRAPQGQPALEVTGAQPDPRVERGVGSERAAGVGPGPEQDRLPYRASRCAPSRNHYGGSAALRRPRRFAAVAVGAVPAPLR
jgi:hypothetical protein